MHAQPVRAPLPLLYLLLFDEDDDDDGISIDLLLLLFRPDLSISLSIPLEMMLFGDSCFAFLKIILNSLTVITGFKWWRLSWEDEEV